MNRILISRTDAIGDVILTLPMAGLLKEKLPDAKIYFLGRDYTLPILRNCIYLSGSFSLDNRDWKSELKALNLDAVIHVFPRKSIAVETQHTGIPIRIGVSRRWYHLYTCNKLLHFSRRNSDLHEAQLNIKLTQPLIGEVSMPLFKIHEYYGLKAPDKLPVDIASRLNNLNRKIILHPMSKGSAKEWGLNNFRQLAERLLEQGYQVIVSGTQSEREIYQDKLSVKHANFLDLGGLLDLEQLLSLIDRCDALVAASTGPLHIAAALGKRAIGLFSPVKPIHPGRWAPLGNDVKILTHNVPSEIGKSAGADHSMKYIKPERIMPFLRF